MPTDNDAQAKALVEILSPLLAEALLPKITEHVEGQIKGLKDKSTELLDKLHNMAKDKEIADQVKGGESIMAKAQALIDGAPKKADGTLDFRKAGENVKISRADARDVSLYRKAKALAAEQKVSLEIVGED